MVEGRNPVCVLHTFPVTAVVRVGDLKVSFGSVVAYSAYNYAISKLSASKVSSYAYVNPLVAVVTGVILLGEPVTPRMIAAMIVILGGVALIQLDRRVAVVKNP